MFAKLTPAQATFLRTIRTLPETQRQQIKQTMFDTIKTAFGIPADHKLRVEVDDITNPNYLTLFRKKDSSKYELAADSRWTGAPRVDVAPQAPAKRWFKVSSAAIEAYADDLVGHDDHDWSEGLTHQPSGNLSDSGAVLYGAYGDIYVALEEADL